jgi:hypothetical protein
LRLLINGLLIRRLLIDRLLKSGLLGLLIGRLLRLLIGRLLRLLVRRRRIRRILGVLRILRLLSVRGIGLRRPRHPCRWGRWLINGLLRWRWGRRYYAGGPGGAVGTFRISRRNFAPALRANPREHSMASLLIYRLWIGQS